MARVLTDREPRVVPTTALGYRFRSTTEARWAIFMRALGVDFEYEPETYDLGELGWYLPDFWLSRLGMHLEVKSSRPLLDVEYDKARALFLLTERPVLVAQGFGRPPWVKFAAFLAGKSGSSPADWPGRLYDIWTAGAPMELTAAGGGPGCHFAVCGCDRVEVSSHGYGTKCRHPNRRWDLQRIERAYDEALAFRPGQRSR